MIIVVLFVLTCMNLFQVAVNQTYFLQVAFPQSIEKILLDTLNGIVVKDDLSETWENGIHVIHHCINT